MLYRKVQQVRVRARARTGRRAWYDVEVIYAFESGLDLAVLRIKQSPGGGGFTAAMPHSGRLKQGQEVLVVTPPPLCSESPSYSL